MGLKCRIKFNNVGVATVLNEDGSPSSLYEALLEEVKDQKIAINIWAAASMPEFQAQTGKTTDTASPEDVINYYSFKAFESLNLTKSDQEGIAQFMTTNGFNSLNDLQSVLKSLFIEDGTFKINRQKAIDFGYTQEDVDNIATENIITLINKIDNFLTSGNEILVPSQDNQVFYVDESRKSIFGTKVVIPENQIYSEIVKGLGQEKTLEEAISSLPYSTFVDNYKNSPSFKSKVDNKFENLKVIQTVYINNGELTRENNSRKEEILNTLIDNADIISIESDLEYLSNISPDVWDFKLNDVREIIKEVEENFAQSNIDIVGLNNFASRRDDVIDLIAKGVSMARTTSEEDVVVFSQAYENLFKTPTEIGVFKIPNAYKNLQIVKVNSTLTDSELFRQFGLIKIEDGLYHKVGQTPAADLYEYVYRNLINGNIVLPVEIDENDKLQSIVNIERYINSLPSNYDSDLSEIVRLNQIVFNHQPIPMVEKISQLNLITTEPGYLRNGFISDFYNYVLSEKFKNSEVYSNVLSKFSVRDNDIVLTGEVVSIDGILFQKELEDYIRLKKDSTMDYLLPPKAMEFVDEDYYYLNNPLYATEIESEYRRERDYLIARTNPNNWVRVGKELFRKVSSKGNTDVFLSIKTPVNTVYFNTSKNFDFNEREAMAALERNQFSEKELDTESLQEKADDRSSLQRNNITSKDVTTLLANYVKTALGYDVNVLTRDQMFTQLESKGYTQLFKSGETVYGFYDNSTKQIMLTDDILNTSTFMHELWHMYKPIVRDQALKGDRTAELLLNKFDSIVSETFDTTAFNQRFDDFLGKGSLSFTEDFQVIGEKGVMNLSTAEQDGQNLILAKQLKEDGVDAIKIKNATGWEQLDGNWVLEVPDLELIIDEVQIGEEGYYNLADVVAPTDLTTAYPNVKIAFNRNGINGYNSNYDIIFLDVNGELSSQEIGDKKDIASGKAALNKAAVKLSLAHEFMHHIQKEEGFPVGTSLGILLEKGYEIAGIEEDDELNVKFEKLRLAAEKAEDRETKYILEGVKMFLSTGNPSYIGVLYERSSGEVTARAVHSRVNLSEEERRNSLIEDSTDTPAPKRLNFKAADLSSSVYDPRQGESRENYISRIKEEIEANLLGENSTQYFENMAKEKGLTSEQTKNFLQRIKDFIGEFSQWLANKLGFKSLTPEQAADLTTKDFLDKVTTSILKDEYSEKVNNLQQILDSDLKPIYLYPETQDDKIKQEIDNCG